MLRQQRSSIRSTIIFKHFVHVQYAAMTMEAAEIPEKSQRENMWINLRTLSDRRSWEMALHNLDSKKHNLSDFNLVEAYKILLKGCAHFQDVEGGRKIQVYIEKDNLLGRRELNSILFHLYTKYSEIADARKVFDMMGPKDVDSWTMMIGVAVKTGHLAYALSLFCEMQALGITPNGITCVNLLGACTMITHLMIIHSFLVSLGLYLNLYLKNTLLNMYCNCGSLENAAHIFVKLPNISEISWNTLIAGYGQHGYSEKAFELFQSMKLQGGKADEVTFVSVIKAGRCNPGLLERLHVEICQCGLEENNYVASALVNTYAVLGKLDFARKAFHAVLSQDTPLWNSMLFCFVDHGNPMEALGLYAEMEKHKKIPDRTTFLGLLKTCAALRHISKGKSVHSGIAQRGFENCLSVGSALVDMYVKCGKLEDARHVFNRMPERDLVSWNVILAGYCDHEHSLEAFHMFRRLRNSGIKPDKVTFLNVLKACAKLGALERCQFFHSCIRDEGFLTDVFLGSTLIDTFGKCGSVYHAREVFENMHGRDAVSWSAMIAGYAQHGMAEEAFDMFTQMQAESIAMDDVTFVAVLTACSHAGLVNEGFECFDLMRNILGIMPTGEICACMVDLLGRAGQTHEALKFMKEVDTDLTSPIWTALLNASKLSSDVKLAEQASEMIQILDPQCGSAFVLLSNVYAANQKGSE